MYAVSIGSPKFEFILIRVVVEPTKRRGPEASWFDLARIEIGDLQGFMGKCLRQDMAKLVGGMAASLSGFVAVRLCRYLEIVPL